MHDLMFDDTLAVSCVQLYKFVVFHIFELLPLEPSHRGHELVHAVFGVQ